MYAGPNTGQNQEQGSSGRYPAPYASQKGVFEGGNTDHDTAIQQIPVCFCMTGSKHTHTQTQKDALSSIEAERVSVVVGCPTRPPRIPHLAVYLLPHPRVYLA